MSLHFFTCIFWLGRNTKEQVHSFQTSCKITMTKWIR